MKTLLILRHAKAQPDAPEGDLLRNLTERGRRDATSIGGVIKQLVGTPDLFVTSDANRARQTAELAADACGYSGTFQFEPGIYLAEPSTMNAIIRKAPDSVGTIVIVGHNTGMEEWIGQLAGGDYEPEHLPTAGLACFELDSESWRDLDPSRCRLLKFTSPRDERENA